MKQFISQGLLLLSEIGVIIVMLIIIAKERRKRKEIEKKNKRSVRYNTLQRSHTLHLD